MEDELKRQDTCSHRAYLGPSGDRQKQCPHPQVWYSLVGNTGHCGELGTLSDTSAHLGEERTWKLNSAECSWREVGKERLRVTVSQAKGRQGRKSCARNYRAVLTDFIASGKDSFSHRTQDDAEKNVSLSKWFPWHGRITQSQQVLLTEHSKQQPTCH